MMLRAAGLAVFLFALWFCAMLWLTRRAQANKRDDSAGDGEQ